MALTAGDCIDQGRDEHPSLSETNAPSVLLLRQLSREVRSLTMAIAPRMPEFLAQRLEVNVADIDFADEATIDLTGYIPGGWLDIPQLYFTWATAPSPGASRPVKATFTPWQQRMSPRRLPAYTFLSNVIYILGPQQAYTGFGVAVIAYVPLPTDFTDEADAVPLPDDAREPLAKALAAFALRRLVGNPQFDVNAEAALVQAEIAAASKKEFLNRVWRLTQRQDGRMRDVNLDPGGPWLP